MIIIGLLTALALVSAITSIVLNQLERVKSFILFKAVTTVLIIIIAIFSYGQMPGSYSAILAISLVFALVGDVFLGLRNYFRRGLMAFLVAQIGFTIAFVSVAGFHFYLIPLLLLMVCGGVFFFFLKDSLHTLKVPIAIYILVFIIMAWQAIGLVIEFPSGIYFAIAAGAILFLISDSVLAWHFFKDKRKWLNIIILATYWIAIWLFAVAGFYIA
jgi:uncharacterized membrane protein YhhN